MKLQLIMAATAVVCCAPQAMAQDIGAVGSIIDFNSLRDKPPTRPSAGGSAPIIDGDQGHNGDTDADTAAIDEFSILATATTSAPKAFTFKLSAPVSYSSNPLRLDGGSGDQLHATPTAVLDWRHVKGKATLSVTALAQHDEFTGSSLIDMTVGGLRLAVSSGDRNAHLSPSVYYFPKYVAVDLLPDGNTTFHDYGIEFGRTFSLCNADSDCGRTLAVDFGYMRRDAGVSVLNMHQPFLSATFSTPLTSAVSLEISQRVEGRLYSARSAAGRDDLNLKSTLQLNADIGMPFLLSAALIAESNRSNQAGSDYFVWDVGPTLGLLWKFGA